MRTSPAAARTIARAVITSPGSDTITVDESAKMNEKPEPTGYKSGMAQSFVAVVSEDGKEFVSRTEHMECTAQPSARGVTSRPIVRHITTGRKSGSYGKLWAILWQKSKKW